MDDWKSRATKPLDFVGREGPENEECLPPSTRFSCLIRFLEYMSQRVPPKMHARFIHFNLLPSLLTL